MSRRPNNPFIQSDITFRESDHKYFDKNGNVLISMSQLLKIYEEPFDKDGFIIRRVAQKEGKTIDEIRAKWDHKRDAAASRGSDFHAQAEQYFLTNKIPDGPDKDILEDLDSKNLFKGVVWPEVLVYSIEYMLAGQSDICEYFKKTNEVKISDFKTNESLQKPSYGKKLLYPLNHLEANLINKYNLQLSGYAYLLERRGFVIIPEHQILWINPKTRKIEVILVKYRKKEIEDLIEHYTKGFEFF